MDELCPTFSHFSVHERKLMILSQYLTVFPSHFNNVFLKYFGLLPNLMRNCKILQKLMRFHKTNNIWWNFCGIVLCFHSFVMYFVDFWFCFWFFQKMIAKFWFHLNRFKISKFRTWQWRKLKKSMSQLPTLQNSILRVSFQLCQQ